MSIKTHRNVIMVVLDTQRFDRLGCYGYDRPTSPNLDRFASTSLFFEQAIAPGQWTIPSHASLFTGEVPAVHLTHQADDVLPREYQTLAARLSSRGIHTTGFCNNPLVGVLQNGLNRGFSRFYNYCGVVPSTPHKEIDDIWKPLRKLWSHYTQVLRRLSYPIQNAFASPNDFFLGALKPFFVPIWTRAGNFKGMTQRSIRETSSHIKNIGDDQTGGHFVFLNLMETHLPYAPPDEFVKKFVPYLHDIPEAHHFIREFNRRAMQWLIPLAEPLDEIEIKTLSDMYDAEVAYQDHLLEGLISALDTDYHRENTLVVFLSDHGEMLGEHGYMGHGFGVYEELIRVPLFMRVPGLREGKHVSQRVSITQMFYTILDYFGWETVKMPYADDVDVQSKSLLRAIDREGSFSTYHISEAYSPENAISIMRRHMPELIKKYHAEATHRAVYHQDQKLIDVEGYSQVMFDLTEDPREANPMIISGEIKRLMKVLDGYLDSAAARRSELANQKFSITDKVIQQRLRDLGYLE
jgi:arylsulfatase A-like enzyme